MAHKISIKFPGYNTPEPPLRERVTPSRIHPKHGLWPCAGPFVVPPILKTNGAHGLIAHALALLTVLVSAVAVRTPYQWTVVARYAVRQ